MKKNTVIVTIFALLSVYSCIKHEVIPAPSQRVDLEAHFTGRINNTDVEWTEDVDGYNGESSFAQYITTTDIDTHVYYSSMVSDLKTPVITVGIGGLPWDAQTIQVPSLNQFKTFFDTMVINSLGQIPTINYSRNAKNGFEVKYKDNSSRLWVSKLLDTGIDISPVQFTDIKIESDNSGDYAKFTVKFGCELYRIAGYITVGGEQIPDYDTIRIEDGVYKGWFKR
jgi:hypothetical protein